MQRLNTLIIACAIFIPVLLSAQEKKKAKGKIPNIISIDEDKDRTTIKLPNAKLEVDEANDTITKITFGNKQVEFIEKGNKTNIRFVNKPRTKFKGHYSGVYLGFCNFTGKNHSGSLQDEASFMNLNSGKSITFGINLLQYNIGIQKNKKNLGFVTGLGWSVYNYRTDNQYIVTLDAKNNTIGELVTNRNIEKNKIVASYINIPFMFEAQIPSNTKRSKAFISAGLYGGFKIGSHVKTIYQGGDKSKSRDDININPFQYGAMIQAGINVIKIYATYNFSTLYEKNNGPELYPYSVGIILASF